MFISSGYHVLPETICESRIHSFDNQHKVNVFCSPKIQAAIGHQKITSRAADDCILVFIASEPLSEAFNLILCQDFGQNKVRNFRVS